MANGFRRLNNIDTLRMKQRRTKTPPIGFAVLAYVMGE